MTNHAHRDPIPVLDETRAGERRRWLEQAGDVIHEVCIENREVTTALIWPRLDFPTAGDGRLLGKAFMQALRRGWMEKAQDAEGRWLAWDHLDIGAVHSADGVLIRQKSLLPIYRSLVVQR